MPDITAARPVAGAPIETLWGQQAHDLIESVFGARTVNGPTASWPFVFSTFTDIPQMVLTGVPIGTHLVLLAATVDATTAGFGAASIQCVVDGVAQAGVVQFMAAAAGYRTTLAGVWLVTVTGAGAVKLQGSKSVNAGNAQAVGNAMMLAVL